jgi:hypothetical protein
VLKKKEKVKAIPVKAVLLVKKFPAFVKPEGKSQCSPNPV